MGRTGRVLTRPVPVCRHAARPALRRLDDRAQRARLLADVGERYRLVGWAAIAVLLVTGGINAVGRWGPDALASPAFWRSEPGTLLLAKLLLVVVIVALSGVHDFVLGPRLSSLSRATPEEPAAAGLRRQTLRLARLNMILALVVVLLAVLLVRPG